MPSASAMTTGAKPTCDMEHLVAVRCHRTRARYDAGSSGFVCTFERLAWRGAKEHSLGGGDSLSERVLFRLVGFRGRRAADFLVSHLLCGEMAGHRVPDL